MTLIDSMPFVQLSRDQHMVFRHLSYAYIYGVRESAFSTYPSALTSYVYGALPGNYRIAIATMTSTCHLVSAVSGSCVFAAMREGPAQENILPEVLHELMSAFDDAPGCSIDSIDHGYGCSIK